MSSLTRNDHVSIGVHDDLLIIVWYQTPTMEDFGLVESATTDLIERKAGGIGLLIVIVEGNDKPPPQGVRRRNAELVARYEGRIWGMARVIEGNGLKKGMMRFVLSTIDLLSSSSVKEKTSEDAAEAIAWLRTLQPRLHERGAMNELERLRRGMPAPGAQDRPAARSR